MPRCPPGGERRTSRGEPADAEDVEINKIAVRKKKYLSIVRLTLNVSRFDSNTAAKDGITGDPTVDSASVVSDLKSWTLNRLDQMEVFVAVHFAQDNVANRQVRGIDRFDGAKLTGLDFSRHRMAARTKRNGLTLAQISNELAGPSHVSDSL